MSPGRSALPNAAWKVVARLKDRVESIAARTRHLPQRPSVACIEWLDPLMAVNRHERE